VSAPIFSFITWIGGRELTGFRLEKYPSIQLIAVGPVIDLYGKFAAEKLARLMELYPERVYSKPEFTALPPYLFTGADFALIPSRDEPFGLVAVEFGRKGALGVGSRLGGLGLMPGWVSGILYALFYILADYLVSGSPSSLLRQSTCHLSSRRPSRKLSNPAPKRGNYSVLVRPFNVSPSSSGVSAPKISTRGVSTLVAGTQDQKLGGRQMEICLECCQSCTREVGTQFNKTNRLDLPGIRKVSWRAPVCTARTPVKIPSPSHNLC
jgi:hypothetical protein